MTAVAIGLVFLAADPSRGGLGYALGLWGFAWLTWIVLVRPHLVLDGHDLVLVGSLRDVRVPAELIDSVAMRAYLELRVGGRRYVAPAIGHRGKDLIRGEADRGRGLVVGEPGTQPHVDNAVVRIREILQENVDAAHRRPRADVPPVRGSWARAPIVVLGALVLAAVLVSVV